MKKIFKYFMIGAVVFSASSCKKFLDVNTNPNSLTEATPALVLPQAIVSSAAISNNFSISLADFSGARANAGGFGGFGATVTYDFGTDAYTGLWTSSYDNANDYQYVIDNTSATTTLVFSTSIARIMKSLAFERLVNQFNDVPYSDALKSTASLQPKYDAGVDVYKACIAELDKSITDITTGLADASTTKITATADPMFGGNMSLWAKFANTIKLRMLIKMAGVPEQSSYATTAFSGMNLTVGFLATDAIVNPGYVKTDRPNPVYSSIGWSPTGTATTTSRIPTKWIYSFYNGSKLADPGRASVIYRAFPSTIINQLGDESAGVPAAAAAGSAWNTGDANSTQLGITKGPTMGTPILLATESEFLQAEAFARGYLSGSAQAAFDRGITQSFTYLYKDVSNNVSSTKNVTADVATYKAANATAPKPYLVNYTAAAGLTQQLEAIITQKYIALNMIANDEAYNEFRRTQFPAIVNGSLDPLLTFASRQSVATSPDKIPSRVLYPQEEFNLNPSNVPQNVNKFTSKIFWDIN
jgi:hypothetical protein